MSPRRAVLWLQPAGWAPCMDPACAMGKTSLKTPTMLGANVPPPQQAAPSAPAPIALAQTGLLAVGARVEPLVPSPGRAVPACANSSRSRFN